MTFVDYPAIAGLASHLRGDPLTVLEPATGERLADVPSASPADVDAAARAASAAQAEWAAMTFDQRAAVLRRAAERLRSQADVFNRCNVQECGSTPAKAQWEVDASYEQLHAAAGLAAQPYGQLIPSSFPGRTNLWAHVPIGVVAIITPWNYPLLLAMRSLAPALALGNAVPVSYTHLTLPTKA